MVGLQGTMAMYTGCPIGKDGKFTITENESLPLFHFRTYVYILNSGPLV